MKKNRKTSYVKETKRRNPSKKAMSMKMRKQENRISSKAFRRKNDVKKMTYIKLTKPKTKTDSSNKSPPVRSISSQADNHQHLLKI